VTIQKHLGNALFGAMIVVQVAALWMWRFFPSQDGPSHLYNTTVLNDYRALPLYQQYYRIQHSLGGNLLADVFLGSLRKIFPPLIAEKILITTYLISFPVAFRLLLSAVAPGAALGFSFFAFVLTYNRYLHLGLWNFCLSVPLVLLSIWVVARPAERLMPSAIGGLTLLGFATYATHIIGWGMLVMATAGILLSEQASWMPIEKRRPLRESVWLFGAVMAPGTVAALFAVREPHPLEFSNESLLARAGLLYRFTFLNSYGETELLLRRTLLVLVLAIAVFVVAKALLLRDPLGNAWLLLAALGSLLVFFGPDKYGDGLWIRERVELFAFLFLVMGLAVSKSSQSVAPAIMILLCGLTAYSMLHRRSAYEYWNTRLADYAALAPRIEPNSIVLPLHFGIPPTNPLLHAVGYWTPKPFIDLWNYEAHSDLFPVRFKPGLASKPPSIPSYSDYLRSLKSGPAPIDYVLVDATKDTAWRWDEAAESSGILADLELVHSSSWSSSSWSPLWAPQREGTLRLYRRIKRVSQ
jgi:hypothetical protein